MAEHSAVNRRVVGSSPTWGARMRLIERLGVFLVALAQKKTTSRAGEREKLKIQEAPPLI